MDNDLIKHGHFVEQPYTDPIPFTWRTKLWGWASFDFELMWKRKRIVECLVIPRQQETDTCYRFTGLNADTFMPYSWTHKGVKSPIMYAVQWCVISKSQVLRINVPKGTNLLTMSSGSTLSALFEIKEPKKEIGLPHIPLEPTPSHVKTGPFQELVING